ncbi:MAG TPA: hypothetical protein VK880_05255 [Anaerolineales bacterium]|nr:hypothetical protein [Anaerolineales bacterium]
MQNNFSDVEQRVKRYWYTDGIGELTGGGMFILLGIYFAVQQYLGENSMGSGLLQAGLVIFLIAGMSIGRWLIKALKARFTYPRTGYVEYHADRQNSNKRRMVVAVVAGMVAAASLAFADRIASFLDLTLALTGILVGMILIFLQGRGSGLERFYVLGGMSIVLGIALSLSSLPQGYGLGLFYSLMGVCFLISGGLTLHHYLSENPLPAETQNG